MPAWLEWGFWLSPFTYAEIGLAINEFGAPRWQKVKFVGLQGLRNNIMFIGLKQ